MDLRNTEVEPECAPHYVEPMEISVGSYVCRLMEKILCIMG